MKRKDEDRSSRSTGGVVLESDRENTLEAFIGQLHAEGVAAGRQEAERLEKAAAAEAAAMVARAEDAGSRLIAEARIKAQALITEGRSELALAVRDAQLELREKLSQGLTMLFRESLEGELSDPRLLRELLRAVVSAYAQADSKGESGFEIRVRPELAEELKSAIPSILGKALADGRAGFDLKSDLRAAGFEYRVHNAVIEVTPESVAEKLSELVTPHLRALLREVAGGETALAPAGGDTSSGPWIGPNTRAGTTR